MDFKPIEFALLLLLVSSSKLFPDSIIIVCHTQNGLHKLIVVSGEKKFGDTKTTYEIFITKTIFLLQFIVVVAAVVVHSI